MGMESINIHLAELGGWRALLSKAEFVAKTELDGALEEYVLRLLFKTSRRSAEPTLSSINEGLNAAHDLLADDFRAIGDHCLLYAGLFPEHAVRRNLPITYYVTVGESAYAEYVRYTDDPIFGMLSTFFVDIVDVLIALRQIDDQQVIMDPINAYHLWRDTGSVAAWKALSRHSSSLPGISVSTAIN
jgi:hypothetical protein